MARWKHIEGYGDRYKLSDTGVVISCKRKMWNGKVFWESKDRILTPYPSKIGYYTYALSKENRTKLVYVHRLVATHFITNPEKKLQVNHKDGNKKNNELSNLEWVSCKENIQHAFRTGLTTAPDRKGAKNSQARLGEKEVREIRKRKKDILATIAREYGISISQVWAIQNNKSWKHI